MIRMVVDGEKAHVFTGSEKAVKQGIFNYCSDLFAADEVEVRTLVNFDAYIDQELYERVSESQVARHLSRNSVIAEALALWLEAQ